MSTPLPLVAAWRTADMLLGAFEPTHEEVVRYSPALASFYNDAHNRSMMANTVAMTSADVVEHFQSLRQSGGRAFLLELDGDLLGDADFRHVDATSAEFAILVGRTDLQGKGIGLRFAILLHALAFHGLGLQTVFVSIIPPNVASQRLFAKLGYTRDDSAKARGFADEDTDLTLSLSREAFESTHRGALAGTEWRAR